MAQNDPKRTASGAERLRPTEPARGATLVRSRTVAERSVPPELAQAEMPPQVESAVMGLMAELNRLTDELSAAQTRVSELEDMADEDPLVPVLNRRGFVRELERTLAYVTRYGTTASVIYIDLDDFKSINDTHGHTAGDVALQHVAEYLLSSVRRSDLVGRLGGDEFAMVLHRADQAAAANKAAQLSRDMEGASFPFNGVEIALGLSAGATELKKGDTVADVLERADRAMFAHKSRNRRGELRDS